MSPVVTAARSMMGAPWRHMARGPTEWDCVGHVRESFRRGLGVQIPDLKAYPRHPSRDNLLMRLLEQTFGPPVAEPQPGDVVAMRFKVRPHHIGIVGDHPVYGLSVIHTSEITRRVAEHGLVGDYRDRVVAFFRWGNG